MAFQINLISELDSGQPILMDIARRWQLVDDKNSLFALVLNAERLELRKLDEPRLGPVYVDFVNGAVAHRRKFGGGKGQAIAKAIGLNKALAPLVLDATAGLGRDAFVLASLGCQVQMIERHPVVAALLEDGLKRACQDKDIGEWVSQRMSLVHCSSHIALSDKITEGLGSQPDIIYLDPMYPPPSHKKKTALVKKEMRVFHSLVGADQDADSLLDSALLLARKRVVVKRPDYAAWLDNRQPTMVIETKKNRFDVYVNAAMTS